MSQSLYSKLLIFFIGITPLIVPIRADIGWFNIDPAHLKLAWSVFFTSIFAVMWIATQLLSGSIRVAKTSLYYPIGLFLLWCFVTLIWVENWYFAIILLSILLSSILIFVIIINTFKSISLAQRLLKTLVFSMAIVSIIGLIQYYFNNYEIVQNIFAQVAKPSSTFGNKNFASHFLVMVLPVSLMFALSSNSKSKVTIYSSALFIGSWYLIYIAARQAYVAVFIEVILIVLFFWIDFYKNKEISLFSMTKLKLFKLISLLLVFFTLIIASNYTNTGWTFESGNKIGKLQKITFEGGSNRIPAWRNTLEMIKDNPISGVGIGQWQHYYPLYYDKVARDVIFNEKNRLHKLHNDYLETFANVGLVGYIFLIWLFVLVSAKIWRVLSNPLDESRIFVFSISMGLIGFLVVAIFSFPVRVFLPLFLVFVYIALIHLYGGGLERNKKSAWVWNVNSNITKLTLLMVATVYIFFTFRFTYSWVVSEDHFRNALGFTKVKMYDYAVNAGKKSIAYNNKNSEHYLVVGEGLLNQGKFNESIFFLEKAVSISNYNTLSLLNLATAYRKSTVVTRQTNKEVEVYKYILNHDPKSVRALSALIRYLVNSNKHNDVDLLFQRLKNSYEYFKDRESFGPYHLIVGYVAVLLNDYKYAQYVYQDGLNRFPTAENYVELATVEFNFMKNLDKGVSLYKQALAIKADVINNHAIRELIEQYESNAK